MSIVLSQDLVLLWLQQLKHILLICCKLLRNLKVLPHSIYFSLYCKSFTLYPYFFQGLGLGFRLTSSDDFYLCCVNQDLTLVVLILLQPNVSPEAKKISIYLNMV